MVCTSGSVQSAADKSAAAQQQVEKLQKMISDESAKFQADFFSRIDASLAAANVTDARQIGFNFDIKTEYTSEFNLDKIANVVVSALKAAEAAKDPTVPNPATSTAAIDRYCDVVVAVAEAAKSSSDSSSSLSYSMNRLGAGVFAFLLASSVNIKDEDTFGSEAVSTTIIFYRLMQSIDDVRNGAAFDASIIDAQNLIKMKNLQAGLTDRLASGSIDMNTWQKLDSQFTAMVKTIQDRLNADKFPPHAEAAAPAIDGKPRAQATFHHDESHESEEASVANKQLVRSSIATLTHAGRLEECRIAVELSNFRLEANYY